MWPRSDASSQSSAFATRECLQSLDRALADAARDRGGGSLTLTLS